MKVFIILACLALAYTYADDADDKCRDEYKACAQKIKDAGVTRKEAFKMRMECGKTYLKCKHPEASAKALCLRKCSEDVKECLKTSDKKFECFKKGKECFMKCKSD